MKKGSVELWRFVLSVLVAVMHFGYFNGYYIAVDFFLILSGYLLVQSLKSMPTISVGTLMKKKIERLYPQYSISLALFAIVSIFTVKNIVISYEKISDFIYEALCIQILFPIRNLYNGVDWYVSAVLVITLVIVILFNYNREFFLSVLAPLIALTSYVFFVSRYGHVDFGMVDIGGVNGGLLRAAAGMCFGCWIYSKQNAFDSYFSRYSSLIIAIAETIVMAYIIIYASFFRQTRFDFVNVGGCAVAVLLAFSNDGNLFGLTDNKVVYFLGRMSYSIYLNQLFVLRFVYAYESIIKNHIVLLVVFLVVLMGISVVTTIICDCVIGKRKSAQFVLIVSAIFIIYIVLSISNNNLTFRTDGLSVYSRESDVLHCSIDFCNGQPTMAGEKYDYSNNNNNTDKLIIEGWAADISNLLNPDVKVSAFFQGHAYNTSNNLRRDDVKDALGEAFQYTGFSVSIPISKGMAGTVEIVIQKGWRYKRYYLFIE